METNQFKIRIIKQYKDETGKELHIIDKDNIKYVDAGFLNYLIDCMIKEKYMNLQFVDQAKKELEN